MSLPRDPRAERVEGAPRARGGPLLGAEGGRYRVAELRDRAAEELPGRLELGPQAEVPEAVVAAHVEPGRDLVEEAVERQAGTRSEVREPGRDRPAALTVHTRSQRSKGAPVDSAHVIAGSQPLALPSRARSAVRYAEIVRRLSLAGGTLVAILGATVLVGWGADLPTLTRVLPYFIPMTPLTAVIFVLLGSSGALLALDEARPRLARAGGSLAALALGLALASLGEHRLGWDTGLDTALFRDRLAVAGSTGRPAQLTAVAFVLLVLGQLGLRSPRVALRRAGEAAALAAGSIGGIILGGYLFAPYEIYRVLPLADVAALTSVGIVLVALCAVGARPGGVFLRIFEQDSAGGFAARLLFPLVIVPGAISVFVARGFAAGWYGADFGLALATTLDSIVVGVVVWLGANGLDRSDVGRRLAEQAALLDPLTGLGNRRALAAQLTVQQALAERTQRAYGIVSLDANGLKRVNDTFGHAVGDAALRRVAAALASALRPADVAVRSGGDEFILLLPATDELGAARVAKRAAEIVRDLPAEDPRARLTVSTGAAAWRPDDRPDDVLARADAALYAAKRIWLAG